MFINLSSEYYSRQLMFILITLRELYLTAYLLANSDRYVASGETLHEQGESL